MKTRIERDPLGEKKVPLDAYYGIQTLRAIENFPISGLRLHPEMVRAIVLVKKAAAEANVALGNLDRRIGEVIVRAADEVLNGKLLDHFVVDVFQAGAGTSFNMNANEVLANRAIELMGGKRGDYGIVHPNDHVNMAQSTNDVFPTAMRLACLSLLRQLMPKLKDLEGALREKAIEFDHVIKSGRTHLEDAAPIRLGQEFGAYASIINDHHEKIKAAMKALEELNIGGTAVGTGLNAGPEYVELVVDKLRALTGFELRKARNLFSIMQSMADFIGLSGALRNLAVDLTKIANDLRLMNSGPVTGLGEIKLPPVQPGSSIMPGKVNPVIAEALNMVAFQVMGNDLAATLSAQAGQLELNVMMPLIAFNLTQSLETLKNGLGVFTERLVKGIVANEERCRAVVERSPGIALALNPYIGYEAAASVVKEALATGKTIREMVLKKGLLSKEELDKVFDPYTLTEPGKPGKKRK